jgi:hypothetical protein
MTIDNYIQKINFAQRPEGSKPLGELEVKKTKRAPGKGAATEKI